jgi:hypothetical protein
MPFSTGVHVVFKQYIKINCLFYSSAMCLIKFRTFSISQLDTIARKKEDFDAEYPRRVRIDIF